MKMNHNQNYLIILLILLIISLTKSLSHEECRKERYEIENCRGYEFINGYKPSDAYHNDVNRFLNFIARNRYHQLILILSTMLILINNTTSTYICNDGMRELPNNRINYQYRSPNSNNSYFNATYFLSLIRDKQFSIVGDSVGMQIFHAINHELYPYQSFEESSDSNGTHVSYRNYSETNIPIMYNPPDYNAAVKYYPKFNATLFFCRDNTLQPLDYIDTAEFCTDKALFKSDIVLIATGAWDKPPLNLLEYHTYDEILTIGENFYETKMKQIHQYIKNGLENERKLKGGQHKPYPLIIWRNQEHTGMIDEYNYYTPNHTFSYADGLFWDTHLKEAEWPVRYNKIMSGLIPIFGGDFILDAYKVSKDMLSFVNTQQHYHSNEFLRSQVHADALHYCAGGMPRALLMPLSDIIEHHLNCRHFHGTAALR